MGAPCSTELTWIRKDRAQLPLLDTAASPGQEKRRLNPLPVTPFSSSSAGKRSARPDPALEDFQYFHTLTQPASQIDRSSDDGEGHETTAPE